MIEAFQSVPSTMCRRFFGCFTLSLSQRGMTIRMISGLLTHGLPTWRVLDLARLKSVRWVDVEPSGKVWSADVTDEVRISADDELITRPG